MPITKACISPPIEAGQSLLNAKQLPSQLTSALEYISTRLAGKRLHLSLVVVSKDVQMPSFSPTPRPQSPAQSIAPTFKRSPSKSSLSSMSSATSSTTSASTVSLSRTGWPSLPGSPKDFNATPPCQSSTPTSSNPYGITLIHASSLTSKAEKILRHTVAKAEKKFSIGSHWLSSQACSSTNDIIHRSLIQNEIVFSSEGLTLFSLDHVYTFKSRLHNYTRTMSTSDFTSSVDDLRRLVLSQQGRRITKGYLMRAYDWLSISLSALVDVNEGYKVAYGGSQRFGGIEIQNEQRHSPPPLDTRFGVQAVKQLSTQFDARSASDDEITNVMGVWSEDKGPHFRGPITPNGYDDLSPVTQGEWSFLMISDSWNATKTVAVETC